MVHVIATITVKENMIDEFLRIFKANVPEVHKEKGCIEYGPTIDMDSGIPVQEKNPKEVIIIEKWQSLDALHAHLKSPHMTNYQQQVAELVENVSIKVLRDA